VRAWATNIDMSDLDRLPPDQSAVLSLVLDRGKSYAEVATLLAIPESTVRDRAHAALDALARATGAPPPSGAVSHDALPSRGAPSSPGNRASPGAPPPSGARPSSDARFSPDTHPQHRAASQAGDIAPATRDTRGSLTSPSSRMGGALLLGAIVAAIVVAAILLSSGGGSKSSGQTSTTPGANSSSTSTASASKPTLNKTIALTPLEPGLKAVGTAYVLSESKRHAFYVAARGLAASSGFFYAVWLYNSPSSSAPLGRAPSVSSNGRMEGGGPLPSNAGQYHQLIITRETSTHPKQPGPIALRGTFGLR
jgi:hypothetical protein